MAPSRLLVLPRELRDLIIQHVLHSSQPELGFRQFVRPARGFYVASYESIAPANMLSTCCQLREETLYHMNDREKTPKLEVHVLRNDIGFWQICVAWKVPPSACEESRSIDHMDIDIKPRNLTFVGQARGSSAPRPVSTSRLLWYENLFRRTKAGDVLGHLISRAVQRLGTHHIHEKLDQSAALANPLLERVPQLNYVTWMLHTPNVVLKHLHINICQDERFVDITIPHIMTQGIRKDILNAMYRCVSSTIACCSHYTELIEQTDASKQLMCYCQHRKIWYTQVGDIIITDGPTICYRLNLENMLYNDITSTGTFVYKRNLIKMMSLRKHNHISHIPVRWGLCRLQGPELEAGVCRYMISLRNYGLITSSIGLLITLYSDSSIHPRHCIYASAAAVQGLINDAEVTERIRDSGSPIMSVSNWTERETGVRLRGVVDQ